MTYTLHLGDCLDVMATLPENSVDTVITDPPYGLIFMGRDWDRGVPGKRFWSEALRVAKPGAMLLAFGGTRTFHRLTVAIEDAGWEIRDCMMWIYAQGFPKSHDISKGIDKAAGVEREVVGIKRAGIKRNGRTDDDGGIFVGGLPEGLKQVDITSPATDAATLWHGWGTALKPAWEPIIVAMKPLDGTFAQNAMKHGVAGLNIEGARIEGVKGWPDSKQYANGIAWGDNKSGAFTQDNSANPSKLSGRWPANLILDEEVAEGQEWARYFYCAKASRSEREKGLEGMMTNGSQGARPNSPDPTGKFPDHDHRERGGNHHPTVKPLRLMEYLCMLTATPTGGVVLDPFMGSGTTGIAALSTGRDFIGIEKEPEYLAIAEKRIAAAQPALVTA